MFMLYSLFPIVVEETNAAFININLLTADFYALIIGVFAYKLNVSHLDDYHLSYLEALFLF